MTPEFLPSFNVPVGIIAWIVFGLVFLVWVGISAVLLYHWRTYGMKNKVILFAETLYIVVSIAILGLAFITLFFT